MIFHYKSYIEVNLDLSLFLMKLLHPTFDLQRQREKTQSQGDSRPAVPAGGRL